MIKTLTAPLAIIKANIGGVTKTVGFIKDVKISETITRADVKGIGTLYPKERPVMNWSGSFTAGSYFIDLKKAGLSGSPNRLTNDAEKFAYTLLLNDTGIQVHIYRKMANEINPSTGIVESIEENKVATIENAFIESDSFNISEGSVSGRDQTFSYIRPILFDSVS